MPSTEFYYKTFGSPLGDVLACASADGVCWLGWTDDQAHTSLAAICGKWTADARLIQGSPEALQQLERELREYFSGDRREFTVPLDLRGTEFEKSVWNALLKIPYGQTKSYGQIAIELGKPKAVRAVGRANGANNIPILIPCHRVISASGTLHGYTGGLWRKQKLLAVEGLELDT